MSSKRTFTVEEIKLGMLCRITLPPRIEKIEEMDEDDKKFFPLPSLDYLDLTLVEEVYDKNNELIGWNAAVIYYNTSGGNKLLFLPVGTDVADNEEIPEDYEFPMPFVNFGLKTFIPKEIINEKAVIFHEESYDERMTAQLVEMQKICKNIDSTYVFDPRSLDHLNIPAHIKYVKAPVDESTLLITAMVQAQLTIVEAWIYLLQSNEASQEEKYQVPRETLEAACSLRNSLALAANHQ